jgi:uncharacterized membrane protein YbhN (UPF0104 family)
MGIDEKMTERFGFKQVVRWIIVTAIFVFLGRMVWDHWNQVKGASFSFEVFPLLLSTLIFAFSYFIQIWAWYMITLKMGIAISIRETLESWFYSQLGKYLPGKIWLFLGRIYSYEARGKSRKSISVALYFEMVTVLMAGGLIFLVSLIFFGEIWPFYSWRQSGWLILFFLLGLVSLHPSILQKILNWVLVRLNREPVSLSISYLDVLWILFICIVAWLVGGFGFYLFVDSIYPVALQSILFLMGALAISSTLGLIAIFAPGGLGVREGVLVYLLSFMMATPVAVIISILTRLWMTLIEIGLIGVIYLFDKFQKRQKRKEHDTI